MLTRFWISVHTQHTQQKIITSSFLLWKLEIERNYFVQIKQTQWINKYLKKCNQKSKFNLTSQKHKCNKQLNNKQIITENIFKNHRKIQFNYRGKKIIDKLNTPQIFMQVLITINIIEDIFNMSFLYHEFYSR